MNGRLLAALALLTTAAGMVLFFPFARCTGCAGKGMLTIPTLYPNHEAYAQECLYCRKTGHVSLITRRTLQRETGPCRSCEGRGSAGQCDLNPAPPPACQWCGGGKTMTAQRVRQYEQEFRDRMERLGK
jgi:hypothetical protein